MLTEIDTRKVAGAEVSLWMDTAAQVYLVAVEGHEPITCLTRDRAVNAYHHPYAYIPLEGHRSHPNGTEGDTATPGPFMGVTESTASVFVQLKELLLTLDDSDFRWTVSILGDIITEISRARGCNRPYNQEEETEF